MNTHNNEGIEKSLSNPQGIFVDNRQNPVKIYISYPNDRFDFVKQTIKIINHHFTTPNELNQIILNKKFRTDNDKLNIQLNIRKNITYLGTAKCNENTYNELLLYREEDVNLSAFFYFMKFKEDTPSQLNIEDRELLDILGINACEYYTCKEIKFKGIYTLKSDDEYRNPATFIP